MKELLLKDYNPIPELVVPEHLITKPKFPVFDIHTHMGKLLLGDDYAKQYDTNEYLQALNEKGIYRIVNLDGFWGQDLDNMLQKNEGFEMEIFNFMWLDIDKMDDDNFEQYITSLVQECYDKGVKGIKMWKDISLYKRDRNGEPFRTDDARLKCVYDLAAKLKLPILIHIGDPTAFFKPVDFQNERYDELCNNPEWQFGDSSKYMRFEELLEMQESMIKNNPDTLFVVSHVASYGENLGYVSRQLSKYPNMYIDIAARIAELGRVPYSAREFFINYQDRILYGSDCSPLQLDMHPIMYRFLETFDEYFPYGSANEIAGQGRWNIYGIGLPDEVLEKVYNKNAERIFSDYLAESRG